MKSWLASLVIGLVLVGAVGFVAMELIQRPGTEVSASTDLETVQGLKRDTGMFYDPSIKVGTSAEEMGAPDVTVDIKVMRPTFIPSEVRVKEGQVVKLRLIGMDSGLADMPELQGATGLKEFSGHGFQILGPYDVWVTGIRKDVVKEVTFKASVAGEFAFECTVFCSPHHYLMQGKLIVEPR